MPKSKPDRNRIELIARTFRVLEMLAESQAGASLKLIASNARLAKSSAFRILYTLKQCGYAEQARETSVYRLTFKMLGLARRSALRPTLPSIARPHLERTRDRLHESAWLAEVRGGAVMLVDGVESSHQLQLSLGVGSDCPLHATAVGKAVAAHLPADELEEMLRRGKMARYTRHTIETRAELRAELARVRAQGFAGNEEETVEGAILFGAPVFDCSGRVLGAVSVSGVTSRCSAAKRKAMIAAVKDAAAAITRDLVNLGFQAGNMNTPAGSRAHALGA